MPMDLSEYVFRVQDLPMIISGVLLTLYIVNIVVLFLESIKTNRRRELTLQSTRTINPKLGFRFIRICRIFGILDLQR